MRTVAVVLLSVLGSSCGAGDDSNAAGGADAATDEPDPAVGGLGPWTGNDNVPPSQAPPFGLAPARVPMFVNLGWDDNAYSGLPGSGGTGGMSWAIAAYRGRTNPAGRGNARTYDGAPARASFYMTSTYAASWISESNAFVRRAWNAALADGHELGNHTHGHNHGGAFTVAQWRAELETCQDWLTRPFDPAEPDFAPREAAGVGVPSDRIHGFRTPFLEYNDAALAAVEELGLRYDCSIEDGYQPDHDGTNFHWPYTLDGGSPGHDVLVAWGQKPPISPRPGLWELPVHPVIVPPDDECERYGVPPGLRARLHARRSWFDPASGKITGFDYNLWVVFEMTKAEFVATLAYTLDLRLRGNRAPLMFGTHSDYYADKYTAPPNASVRERQEAIEELLDYALSKPEVRVVSNTQILDWVRNPSPL